MMLPHSPALASASEAVTQARDLAEQIHRLFGWAAPIDPRLLARAAGVGVQSSLALGGLEQVATDDVVLYARSGDDRVDGLRIALGLAQSLLVRARVAPTATATRLLAGELVAPPWLLGRGARTVAGKHPWAPAAFVLAHHEAAKATR